MKICYLANISTHHAQKWAKYFVEGGHEVHIISFEHSNAKSTGIKLNGMDIHMVKTNKKYLNISAPYKFLQFRRILKAIKPDIVHAHYVTKYGVIGAFSGFHPFVVSAWGSDVLVNPKESIIFKNVIKYALKKTDLITCDGENSRDAMVNLGINPEKIKIIYHGVDTQVFNPDQRDRGLIQNLFGKERTPIVISARGLIPRCNVETFIKSIPLILKKIPDAKFIIVGDGPEEDYLGGLTKSFGISESVKFVGWLPINAFAKHIASSDVYVCTSLLDGGVPVTTLDAMACELAPVVTDVADNSKWIKEGENGFIIPTKNPEVLAEKVIYLLENEEIRRRFGEINRRLIKERQEYAKNMEEMETLYKKLIGVV